MEYCSGLNGSPRISFSERGPRTENNGTIINVQLLMVMEKFNFFKNFGKSKKKSMIFTN